MSYAKWTEDFSWKCGICGKKRRDVEPVQDFEVGDACPEHYEGIECDSGYVADKESA